MSILPPFDPAGVCGKCGTETITVTYHPRPVLDPEVRWPCWPADPPLGGHLCRRSPCSGYAWCEAPADTYAQQ